MYLGVAAVQAAVYVVEGEVTFWFLAVLMW